MRYKESEAQSIAPHSFFASVLVAEHLSDIFTKGTEIIEILDNKVDIPAVEAWKLTARHFDKGFGSCSQEGILSPAEAAGFINVCIPVLVCLLGLVL